MKFSENMYLMIILKVTKKQGFTLSLKDTFFEKPQGSQFDSPPLPPPAVLGLTLIKGRFKVKVCFVFTL